MIELIQFPWSPFCLVQRRILEYCRRGVQDDQHPASDRSLVWRLTRQRYYGVPIIRDGRTVVFETDDYSQIIAKYLDGKLQLGLFPKPWQGIDRILWRNIEDQIEGAVLQAERHLLGGVGSRGGATGLPAPQGAQVRPRLPGPMARPASRSCSSS